MTQRIEIPIEERDGAFFVTLAPGLEVRNARLELRSDDGRHVPVSDLDDTEARERLTRLEAHLSGLLDPIHWPPGTSIPPAVPTCIASVGDLDRALQAMKPCDTIRFDRVSSSFSCPSRLRLVGEIEA